jgi:hypothetical protein
MVSRPLLRLKAEGGAAPSAVAGGRRAARGASGTPRQLIHGGRAEPAGGAARDNLVIDGYLANNRHVRVMYHVQLRCTLRQLGS